MKTAKFFKSKFRSNELGSTDSGDSSRSPSQAESPHDLGSVTGTSQSHLSEDLSTAKNGWQGFKFALDVLKEVSVVFPPLQAAVGGLLKIIRNIDQASDNQDDFKAAIHHIRDLSALIEKYDPIKAYIPPNVLDRIDGLSQSIKRRSRFIQERMQKGSFRRIVDSSDAGREITNTLRELAFAVELFQVDTSVNTEAQSRQTLQIVNDIHERELLKILDVANGAPYNESSRSGCMDGTRVDTLTRLLAWGTDPNSPSICWLSGMAGIGKSAIAQSFCKMVDDGRLGGSFFCSRQSKTLNKVNRILPTIAYQLAYRSQTYRTALIGILKQTSRRSFAFAALQEQARDLFIEPLKHIRTLDRNPMIIVVDALDECTGHGAVSDFLRVVLRSDLPLKFLITSRPELHIDKGFSPGRTFEIDAALTTIPGFRSKLLTHASLRLHDVENDVVEDDITRYLSSKLSYILEDTDDMQTDITALAKKSGNLFIFAFTAIQYISNSNLSPMDVRERLSTILRSSEGHSSGLSTQSIDNLYRHIFTSAYREKEESEISSLRQTLGTLLCLREPQSITVIATLLQKEPHVIRVHLGNFSSVLDVPRDDDAPVFIFHASFPDYVYNRRRSKAYTLDADRQHHNLALACLKVMNRLLREDLCGITVRQTRNANIDGLVLRDRIPPVLRYSCVSWASHLGMIGSTANPYTYVLKELKYFVDRHMLHWLECLSLIQELHVAFSSVQKALLYLSQDAGEEPDSMLREDVLLDVQHMIPQCYYFLKSYALEVYVSALAWLPIRSALRAKYARKIPGVLQGLHQQWGTCLQMLQSQSPPNGLAYSPNGVNLACGSEDPVVRIWNLETGEVVKELAGHAERIIGVAFSPDGLLLVSGSVDETLRVWNVETGEPARTLLGHVERVNAVAFSPDGSRIASGSDDQTVRIWNTETGEPIKVLVGHSGVVSAVAFYPDGSKLVSGSGDHTARIWDTNTGELVKQLSRHTAWIRAIAISRDGSVLASGSADKSIRTWNGETGQLVRVFLGHTDQIRAISLSPDGTKLASGSVDETVRIWDVETGELVIELLGHTQWVNSVKFSPDGSKLASGSADKNIRIWNVESARLEYQLANHAEKVSSIVFSPDESMLASGSDDKAVKIWNASSGELIHNLQGHRDCVTCVAFSPDGYKLASGSDDMTVMIWDIKTGELMKVLLGHSHWVTSVVFSCDGSKLASGNDETLRIWDIDTGNLIKELVGHTAWIMSTTFSPDGAKLASGAGDGIIRVWNVERGELLKELQGHPEAISEILFSPDSSMLASASADRTVKVWDIGTGDVIKELQNYTNQVESDIFSPESSPVNFSKSYILDHNQQCIVSQTADGGYKPQLWIWGEYLRNLQNGIYHSSFSSTRGCIAYETGRVVILALSEE